MKPRISEVIIVEGRYDKNTLLQVVDASVLELGGFRIYHNRELLDLLRRLAAERGLILFTDPDGAGFQIRNFLRGALPPDRVKHAYIPDIYGKERRKRKAGKEGKLGVEGMKPEVILDALRAAGATIDGAEISADREPIMPADLMDRGLVGEGSRAERARLLKYLHLPERLTTGALLEVLNILMDRKEFLSMNF